jgi:alpha-methylacyl-CoA racemase
MLEGFGRGDAPAGRAEDEFASQEERFDFVGERVRRGVHRVSNRFDAGWAAAKEQVAAAILTKSRDEWMVAFTGADACVAPVLEPDELFEHPHHKARDGFVEVDGVLQPAPAPRFSRSVAGVPGGAPANGSATDEILVAAGLATERIAELRASGVVGG